MAQIYSNDGNSLLVSAIDTDDTTLSITPLDGGKFRAPGIGEYEVLVLTDGVNWEIVKMTGRSGDALTVQRAYEGVAQSWDVGTIVRSTVTRKTMENLMQTDVYSAAVALFNYQMFR